DRPRGGPERPTLRRGRARSGAPRSGHPTLPGDVAGQGRRPLTLPGHATGYGMPMRLPPRLFGFLALALLFSGLSGCESLLPLLSRAVIDSPEPSARASEAPGASPAPAAPASPRPDAQGSAVPSGVTPAPAGSARTREAYYHEGRADASRQAWAEAAALW